MHFAASTQVEESVLAPGHYRNNVINTLNLLEASQTGVRRLIFLDRRRLGHPRKDPRRRAGDLRADQSLRRLKEDDRSGPRRLTATDSAIRRSATSTSPGRIRRAVRQAYSEATHLITRALKTAKAVPEAHRLRYDYPTPDGT